MTIIIGLGNPGKKYKNTRHNVGFMAINKFAETNNFPEFKLDRKSNSLLSEKDGALLVKPQTFMNESGKAVKEVLKNKPMENLIIIHDDIDLPVGKIKIIKERGSAGHKGVESTIQNIGNDGLIRFRIGIGGQNSAKAKKIVLIDPMKCDLCRKCEETSKGEIEIGYDEKSFIVSFENHGNLESKEILSMAAQNLNERLEELKKELKKL